MSDNTQQQQSGSVQTPGHAWDGDLQEFNNPLPRWWVWTFYATVVFSLVYWIIYPTWPYANTYTKGLGDKITYVNDEGEEVTTHWNTRSLLIHDMQTDEDALKQKAAFEKLNAASYEQILSDPDLLAINESAAKVLYADNCAACHGPDAALPGSAFGLYPNLADDAWLWGGTLPDIERTLQNGRTGYMPGFAGSLDEAQLDQVALAQVVGVERGTPSRWSGQRRPVELAGGGQRQRRKYDVVAGNHVRGQAVGEAAPDSRDRRRRAAGRYDIGDELRIVAVVGRGGHDGLAQLRHSSQ